MSIGARGGSGTIAAPRGSGGGGGDWLSILCAWL